MTVQKDTRRKLSIARRTARRASHKGEQQLAALCVLLMVGAFACAAVHEMTAGPGAVWGAVPPSLSLEQKRERASRLPEQALTIRRKMILPGVAEAPAPGPLAMAVELTEKTHARAGGSGQTGQQAAKQEPVAQAFTVTAYCACQKCCGKTPDAPGYGITATGTRATQGRTVAVDPDVVPLGSQVVINGKTYIAEDTGVRGKWIDVYFDSHQEALVFGRQTLNVVVKG